ncbi:hypothetical protein [Streptomyces longispororuber]|uniref:hypothetical protein n=1 Tax=Streptomyces longispororuber TaxID=68230 RepID=UPI00210CD216|nr:hypothetical protein [Streptomyces longispororuber]MCQ4211230.1 hypothetical protein [Streptomyces longispororuber]
MAHDGHRTDRSGAIAGTLGLRGAPYRFALLVSAVTAVAGCGIVAAGFAGTWGAFDDVRDYADRNIANEDSYVAYADGGMEPLLKAGAVVAVALLLLGLLVVAVLHAAYAVADARARRGEGNLGTGELWRRTRRRLPAAVATNALTGLVMGAVVLAGLILFAFVDGGLVPGVEPTPLHGTASPQYALLGWVLPIAIWCAVPLLHSRLSLATAEAVLEHRSPFVALYRSWVLTRRARRRTVGTGALAGAAAVLVVWLGRYAAEPLSHPVGLGMLWLSDDNVWMTGVLVLILPTAVALLLLPPLVMPLTCASSARLHGELRAEEDAVRAAADA